MFYLLFPSKIPQIALIQLNFCHFFASCFSPDGHPLSVICVVQSGPVLNFCSDRTDSRSLGIKLIDVTWTPCPHQSSFASPLHCLSTPDRHDEREERRFCRHSFFSARPNYEERERERTKPDFWRVPRLLFLQTKN